MPSFAKTRLKLSAFLSIAIFAIAFSEFAFAAPADDCPLIVTVPDFDAAAREIALRFARIAPVPPIVRIEGVCGAGNEHRALPP